MTLRQEQYNKAQRFVADRYLSSPEGMREVQKMQEYFERENEVVNIGVQIMNLLPDSLHNSRHLRAHHVALRLAQLFDLTPTQKDFLALSIEKWTTPAKPEDLPDDDDLPF